MPIYNNPAIAEGVANLQKLFAPPSAQEMASLAIAGERNAKARRDAEAYAKMTAPDATPSLIDQFGVASGTFLPTQTYHALDVGDATTRRGQDVSARTSIANNSADNARALATNTADNARALDQTRLTSLSDFYKPVAKDALRPAVPAEIATMFGAPGALPEVQGNRSAPTEAEVKGAILRGLPVEDQRATMLGDIPVEQIIMGDGKTPQFVRRNDAVGRQPYIDPKTVPKATNGLAVLADGTRLPALQTADGRWANAQTGAVLPDDVQIFDTPKPQGTAQEVGVPGKSTEFSDRNAIFYNRASPADSAMNDLLGRGYVPSARDYELILGGAGDKIPLSISNHLVSTEGRQFYNQAQNFMLSVLRPDTGAAFGKEEFANYARVFVPLPGDDATTIKAKADARTVALAALQGTSRGAADAITKRFAEFGLQVPPEMLARLEQNAKTGAGGAVTSDAPAASDAPASAAPRRLKFNPATGGFE